MIGKIMSGMKFAGLVDYLNKGMDKAKLLASEGVCTVNRDTIVDSFSHQAKDWKKSISKPVGHISLSWHINDAPRLTDELMVKVAKDYMERMGIRDTQYLLVRHFDRQHPHLHIVYNRVDNNGNTISDSNERVRNMKVCKDITNEYGFYMSQGKQNVNRDRLKGRTKTLYKNRDLILAEARKSHSWSEFNERLSKHGIKISFRYGQNGQGIVGVVFSTKEQSYGGAKLDKELSFQALDLRFGGELSRIAYQTESSNDCSENRQSKQIDSTFVHHLPKAAPSASEYVTSDGSEPDATETSSANNDDNVGANNFVLIGFDTIMELILQPHQVHVSSGGGGSNNRGWRDKDKDDYRSNKSRRGRR